MKTVIDRFAYHALAGVASTIMASVFSLNKELIEEYAMRMIGRNSTLSSTQSANQSPLSPTQTGDSNCSDCACPKLVVVIAILVVVIVLMFCSKKKKKIETITVTIEGVQNPKRKVSLLCICSLYNIRPNLVTAFFLTSCFLLFIFRS